MFEVVAEERRYEFFCDPDAPLGAIYDALVTMEKYIVNQMKKSSESEKE